MTANRLKGISFQTVDVLILGVPTRAAAPNTKRRFAMFEPITFPKAVPVFPPKTAIKLTMSSGADVPKATIVSPIIKDDTPYFLAKAEEPSTNQSAPLIKIAMPKIRKIISMRREWDSNPRWV